MTLQTAIRPDFSGRWTVDRNRSELGLAALAGMTSMVVEIHQTPDTFALNRSMGIGDRCDRTGFVVPLDGEDHLITIGERAAHIQGMWFGDTLGLQMRVYDRSGIVRNNVCYTLQDGGATLEAYEESDGPDTPYLNRWVLCRQP